MTSTLSPCFLNYFSALNFVTLTEIIVQTAAKAEKRRRRKKEVRRPGVEPGSTAWKATMLTVTPPTLADSNLKIKLQYHTVLNYSANHVCAFANMVLLLLLLLPLLLLLFFF